MSCRWRWRCLWLLTVLFSFLISAQYTKMVEVDIEKIERKKTSFVQYTHIAHSNDTMSFWMTMIFFFHSVSVYVFVCVFWFKLNHFGHFLARNKGEKINELVHRCWSEHKHEAPETHHSTTSDLNYPEGKQNTETASILSDRKNEAAHWREEEIGRSIYWRCAYTHNTWPKKSSKRNKTKRY